jgi:D-methionine transport system permease protein
MGILLVTSEEGGIKPFKALNLVLNIVVNITRSIPFLILLIAVIPFTRLITGTSIGSTATIVPLVLAAAPFIARLVESSLKEVDQGIVEASLSMGASPMQIVTKVLIPEAKPSLLMGAAIAVTTILGYSAMAGIVGGGGLGDIAIRFGYYRYETGVMIVTVVLLVIIVQFFQEVGMRIAQKSDKRK